MDESKKLKIQVAKLLNILDYFEDEFVHNFDTLEKGAFVEKFGELLIEDGVLTDLESNKNRRKLKKEWQNLEMRIHKFTEKMFPLTQIYFGKEKGSLRRKEETPKFRDSLVLDYYNKTEVAKVLGVSRQTVHNWVENHHLDLKTIRKGARDVITKEELIRFHKANSG